jgi:hypothetical protein
MPIVISYAKEPIGAISVYSGVITGGDVIAHLERLRACEQCTFRIADMRTVTQMSVSLPELHRIAILECSIPDEYKLRKLALVGDTVKYRWLIDTYYLFVERWIGKRRQYETQTFTEIEQAYKWVDLKE